MKNSITFVGQDAHKKLIVVAMLLSPYPAAESDIELVEALMISRAKLEDRFRSSGR